MSSPKAPRKRDGGFSLIEVLIVVTIMGIVVSTLSTVIIVIIKSTPSTSTRIDDARTLRGMSTWLAQDVTSTPPFTPENSNGGVDTATTRNDCGAPGTNILHLTWIENTGGGINTYVASYRYLSDAEGARMMRYTCARAGSGSFSAPKGNLLTAGLSTTQPPTAAFDMDAGGRITVVKVRLYGESGEFVIVDTSSRNPAEFLP